MFALFDFIPIFDTSNKIIMKTVTTSTGKKVSIAIASIYVREAFKKTICFLPEDVQIARMIEFNKSLFTRTPKN